MWDFLEAEFRMMENAVRATLNLNEGTTNIL